MFTRDFFEQQRAAVRLEGAVFLAYAALVGWLVWRLQRQLRRVRPMCPNCAASLEGMSLRVAAATGRCDTCGAQIIE